MHPMPLGMRYQNAPGLTVCSNRHGPDVPECYCEDQTGCELSVGKPCFTLVKLKWTGKKSCEEVDNA